MKTKATQYSSDWEYRKAQQAERKEERSKRDVRKGRKHQWNIKEAEAA